MAGFGHLGDQHRAGHRADFWGGSQDGDGFGQFDIGRDSLLDATFQLCDPAVQQFFEIAIHIREHVRRSELSV